MIYFVRHGDDGPVKIGVAKDVPKRIAVLQTSHFANFVVIRTLDAPSWVEGWLHGYFAALHLHGEWFRFDEDMLAIEPPDEKPSVDITTDTTFPVKKLVNLTEEQSQQITTFRYDQRLPSDNEAIRRLIEIGLAASKPKVPARAPSPQRNTSSKKG